jgi:hypothetical protein
LGSRPRTCVRSVLELDALFRNSLLKGIPARALLRRLVALLLRPDLRRRARSSGRRSAFLRELSKGTKASPVCQAGKHGIELDSFSPLLPGQAIQFESSGRNRKATASRAVRAAQSIKEQPATCPHSPQRTRRSLSFRVLQWDLFSRGIALRGSGAAIHDLKRLPHPSQRTSFPSHPIHRSRPDLTLQGHGKLHCLATTSLD